MVVIKLAFCSVTIWDTHIKIDKIDIPYKPYWEPRHTQKKQPATQRQKPMEAKDEWDIVICSKFQNQCKKYL